MHDTLRFAILASIDAVSPQDWDALLDGDTEATPFQRWVWLDALEKGGCAVPARGWHPHHVVLFRGTTLIAAAPAYVRDDSQGEFVFDFQWARAAERAGIRYYPKLVLAVPFTPAQGRRVLVAAGEDREARTRDLLAFVVRAAQAEGLSGVHLLFATPGELEAAVAEGGALRAGVQFHWQNAGYRSVDDFLGRFSSKRRNQLRREWRAPGEQAVEIVTRRGDALTVDDAERVHTLYASTVDRFLWGRRYLTPTFFADILGRFRQHLELVEATHAGQVIAGAFNVASPTHLYGRYWGCLEARPFLHFNVCYYHSIAECIRRGVGTFEGGAGGDHKLSRGFEPAVTGSAHWVFHPGLSKAIREFVGHEREAILAELPALQEGAGLCRPPAVGGERME